MAFDPYNVNLSTADQATVVCFLEKTSNDYDGRLGERVSALFVILIVSTGFTFFPVIAKRVPKLRIPSYLYLFARYFGAGVIVATAFIHLLDPAYGEIGPNTCVGMTGGWADYSWCKSLCCCDPHPLLLRSPCMETLPGLSNQKRDHADFQLCRISGPAIVLTSVMIIFLMDFGAERYVEIKYGPMNSPDVEATITTTGDHASPTEATDRRESIARNNAIAVGAEYSEKYGSTEYDIDSLDQAAADRSFRQQIAAFLILEFGVIFHSVIIGLNLGVVGAEFSTLYPVLVFHQSFEGLGIGAR